MKQWVKSTVSIMCVIAMMLSVLCVGPLTTSAQAVQPRNVQRQWETKWKSVYYGGRTVYDTACGIFAIVNAIGYVTGNEMSVTEVCQWAYNIKAFNYSSGGTTRAKLYPYLEAKYGEDYGFTVDCNGGGGYWAGASSTKLKNHLANGGVAIGHVLGHFIAVVDYDSSTNKFRVFDSAPSSSRGTNTTGTYGYGDCWVTQSWFSSSTKLTLDWFVLVTGTGNPINLDYGEDRTATTADKIGTYQLNSKAPSSDPLNVRAGAGTSYDIVGTVQEGDIVYASELSGGWGNIKKMDGSVSGWASISSYADYIGIDALGGTPSLAWGDMTTSIDEYGRRTIVNNSATETVGYDLYMPISIGTSTTPYMSLQITPNYGNGYYFGVSQNGTGYWMMRDCNSSDQLVAEDVAPYMTGMETLEINLSDWWKPDAGYRIDTVRLYVAPSSSITVNYFYFAAESGKVTDTTYNLVRQEEEIVNHNLMNPDGLSIADTSKAGSYVYDNGQLTVTSESDAGYEVVLDINKDYTPQETANWLFDLVATTGFDIQLIVTTSGEDKSLGLVSEFWPGLCDSLVDGYLPAETYYGVCDVYSVYTWNDVVPANGISTIKQVKILLSGAGSVTIDALQISNTTDIVNYADGVYKSDSSTGTTAAKGDINTDGDVTTVDARMLLQYSLDLITFTDAQKAVADYDGDGTLSTVDVRKMLQALIG